MSSTFAQLGVPSFIIDALAQRGITEPFEIQAATIADSLAGRDVCGRAPTGSGKTLAFGVPLIANVAELGRSRPHRPAALVLAPTRELAEQIMTELESFAGQVRLAAVYGGVGFGKQLSALRKGVDVLVACPGRLEDLIQRGDVSLQDVSHVVLDEADRMADMGFLPVVRRLLDQTASKRQTVLFSATLDGAVGKLTREYQHNPVRHEVGEETPDITSATHLFWRADRASRNGIVAEVVNAAWPSVVFVRTKHGADRLARQLGKLGIEAAAIHGNRSQSQRQRALDSFAGAQVHALVATDVAARGIHVDGVASVIHYDPPADHKDYIHRSGRTARAGADGVVVSLVQPDQSKDVRKMISKVGLDAQITDTDIDTAREASGGPVTKELKPTPAEPQQRQSGPSRSKSNGGNRDRNRNRNRNRNRSGSGGNDDRRQGESRGDGENRGSRNNEGGKRGGQGGNRKRRDDNRKSSSSRNRSKPGGGNNNQRSGGPNRKARRAHLQSNA